MRALTRLLHLSSSVLPVGAFSYSQGLEAAAQAGHVGDAAGAGHWIQGLLDGPMALMDAPLWLRLFRAWKAADHVAAVTWNDWFLASRETAELRAETVQMGYSLRRLMLDLHVASFNEAPALRDMQEPSFPAMHAFCAAAWGLDEKTALGAWLWSWLENQVMSAVRIVPLGQTDGQRLLMRLSERLTTVASAARRVDDEDIGALAPGLAYLSSLHETQYTRIFRS